MKLSIKVKSSLFLAALLVGTVIVLSILVLQGIKQNQQKQTEETLARQSKLANVYVKQVYLSQTLDNPQEFYKQYGREIARQIGIISSLHVTIFNMSGKVVGDSLPLESTDIGDTLSYALKGKIAYQEKGDTLSYFAPIYNANKQIGVVQFDYSLINNQEFYDNTINLFIKIGLVTTILSFIIGYFFFNSLVMSILKLRKVTEEIKLGNYPERSILSRKDELGYLSQAIFYMSNEIQSNIKGIQQEKENLQLAVEKLKILEKQQKQFIGSITHEFKTPLTVIRAYIDLLDMYSDDPKLLEEAISNIGKESLRLYDMVEKILKLAELEKYDFEIEKEAVDIKSLLEDICSRMKGKMTKFGLAIHTNFEHATILIDKESFTLIMMNLLDNAIKYNKPNGEISVSNIVENNQLIINVTDTGIGISPTVVDKIFEPFFTVNKDRSRQSGGSGLGLALTKDLIEKQNGTIQVESIEGSGSSFIITFPIVK
ncbi:HAMP domain-containing sensor histidine kinase [Bacillus sp. AFS017336]|uniref:sensor histidine kinase n=1 Tax=Bacillus sp. AFS017336 TaxID=2033489 RepID=UPI000BEF66BA|nr:HAMP domain-containing sensor histidine kinase [Bacillus sp. AFS017336]PEL09865.1 two-component sensor histidine kinase [Bacillus sp. AFS017336]